MVPDWSSVLKLTKRAGVLMSMWSITVKALFVLLLKPHGLSISAFNQYRIRPYFPSKEVATLLQSKQLSLFFKPYIVGAVIKPCISKMLRVQVWCGGGSMIMAPGLLESHQNRLVVCVWGGGGCNRSHPSIRPWTHEIQHMNKLTKNMYSEL